MEHGVSALGFEDRDARLGEASFTEWIQRLGGLRNREILQLGIAVRVSIRESFRELGLSRWSQSTEVDDCLFVLLDQAVQINKPLNHEDTFYRVPCSLIASWVDIHAEGS